jgi:hypothetical protein
MYVVYLSNLVEGPLPEIIYLDAPDVVLTHHLRVEKDDTVRISGMTGEWIVAQVIDRVPRRSPYTNWDSTSGGELFSTSVSLPYAHIWPV